MPLYSYECECGESFEIICSSEERDSQECPDCGSTEVTRLFFAPYFIDTYSPMHPRKGRGQGVNKAVGSRNKDE